MISANGGLPAHRYTPQVTPRWVRTGFTPGWGVRCRFVCLASGFSCPPPLLAGVLGCVYVSVHAPLVPRHSWQERASSVCVLGLVFWLRPTTPGWGVGGSSRCAPSACTPPFLAGACGMWTVCCLAPVLVPSVVVRCAHCPGLRHPVVVVAWHLSMCPGCGRRRTSLACLVAPRWCAAPRPVRSLSLLPSALPTLWCLFSPRGLAPPDLLGGCVGRVEASQELGSVCLPLAAAEAGALGSLRVVPVWGPAMGLSLAGPLGCVRCGGLRVWTRSLTRPVSRTARPSLRGSAGAPGLFCVGADTALFGSEDATPGSRACVRVRAPLGRVGRAGLPGACRCASLFPVAGLAAFFLCPSPSGLGLPFLWLLL